MKNNQPNSEIIIYQTETNDVRIDVRLEDDTVWLTQAQLVDLYQSSKANISEHIKNIFSDGELDENVVVRKFRTTTKHGAIEGKTQTIEVKLCKTNFTMPRTVIPPPKWLLSEPMLESRLWDC